MSTTIAAKNTKSSQASAGDQLVDLAMQIFLAELKGLWDIIKFSGKRYTKVYNGKIFEIRCAAGWHFGKWFEIIISYGGHVVHRTGRQNSPAAAEQQAEAFIMTFSG
jgi:hypothetical protein